MAKAPTQEFMIHHNYVTDNNANDYDDEFALKAAADDLTSQFSVQDGFLVKQTMKGCCCNAKNEFTIHGYVDDYSERDAPPQQVMFSAESAGCCLRCLSHFAPGCRATSFDMWRGEDGREKGVSHFLTHQKKRTNGRSCWVAEGDGGPLRIPCCCNLPYLETVYANRKLGRTQYICDRCLFVPKYDVFVDNRHVYRIRPDVCLGGVCVKCQFQGGKGRCCAVPFYIRKPTPDMQGEYEKLNGLKGKAEIVNFWSGGAKECCQRQNYALKYPQNATLHEKATLMGSVFLIEMLEFEQN